MNFCLPFGGHLRGDNLWVKLPELIPWELVEEIYTSQLHCDFGAPAHSARMVLGSLLINEGTDLIEITKKYHHQVAFISDQGCWSLLFDISGQFDRALTKMDFSKKL